MTVLVFDVNETLIDLGVLRPTFERVFDSPLAIKLWFTQLLRLSHVATLTGQYQPFNTLGGDALGLVAQMTGVELTDEDRAAVVARMSDAPPHTDVVPGLTRLKEAGFRLAALTNSSHEAMTNKLTNAGLAPFFEQMLSVDGVQKFKPALEVYRYAADQLRIATSEMLMVAAHDWDITGAMRAGCQGAYITRMGQVVSGSAEIPTVTATDLLDLATQLIQ